MRHDAGVALSSVCPQDVDCSVFGYNLLHEITDLRLRISGQMKRYHSLLRLYDYELASCFLNVDSSIF